MWLHATQGTCAGQRETRAGALCRGLLTLKSRAEIAFSSREGQTPIVLGHACTQFRIPSFAATEANL